jgi:iron complex outermembrane receptor protein
MSKRSRPNTELSRADTQGCTFGHAFKRTALATCSFAGLTAALAGAATSASAQAAQPAAPRTGVGGVEIGEVIVTAQRREQTLQRVPVAVSTLNAAQIEARQLNNLDQISGIAPNLTITVANNAASSTQVAIRGSVTTNNTISYDPAVGLYLDGVYIGKAGGSVFDIGDLERVEVLRGPQGTLFGRNTLAGAISFVTRKPSDKFRLEGEFSYGNYNYRSLRGLVNVPVTDNLFIKLSGQFQKRDGFTKLTPDPLGVFPTASGEEDDRDRNSIMLQVRWQPTDKLTLDYSYDRTVIDEHPYTGLFGIGTEQIYDQLAAQGVGTGNMFSPTSPFYANIPLFAYAVGEERPDTSSSDRLNPDYARVYGHSLTATYDAGFATLKSITAYRRYTEDQGYLGSDVDGAPLPIALGGFIASYEQFSQELQMTGTALNDRLNYVVGAYYFHDVAEMDNPQSYFFGATNLFTNLGLRSQAYAVYGQADYKVTDKLTLTLGARWNAEKKTVRRLYQVIDSGGVHFDPPLTVIDVGFDDQCGTPLGTRGACEPPNHQTFYNISPTAILAYQFTPDINAYVKYSIGYRSGNFNADAGPSTDPLNPALDVLSYYRPEKNKSLEVGLKTRWFDRRLTVNVAAFYNKEEDKQVASFLAAQASSTINRNAGEGRVQGVEVEIDARPLDNLHVYGSLGLLDAKFDEYLDTNRFGQVVDVADNRYYPKAPKTSVQGGFDYDVFKRDDLGTLTFSTDVQYQSKTFALPGAFSFDPNFPLIATADQYVIPESTIVNMRLRWNDLPFNTGGTDVKYYAMLWVKNLTDYKKVQNKIEFGPNFGGLIDANYHDPRTFGFTVGFKY